jgi:hypothetical protein
MLIAGLPCSALGKKTVEAADAERDDASPLTLADHRERMADGNHRWNVVITDAYEDVLLD